MNRRDLQRLSNIRLSEAKVLLDSEYYSGAYYLLGYAVECALKACIAKQIERHEFPNRRMVLDSYTHDLRLLLKVSGLEFEFLGEVISNPALDRNWTTVSDWTVDSRYEYNKTEVTVREFHSAVTARANGFLPWLRRRW